jgi:ribosome assembly protein RRB1
MDWSATKEGRFLSGDCDRFIYLYDAHEGHWAADTTPFTGHSASVEDLQWSPSEVEVFASCSVDKTIKIWDARMKARPGLSVDAHNSDVNVISWNKCVRHTHTHAHARTRTHTQQPNALVLILVCLAKCLQEGELPHALGC